MKMVKMIKEIKKYLIAKDKLFDAFECLSSYNLAIPSGLKGNIGEYLTMMELLKRFKNKKIEFLGGINRSFDILFDNKKIDVKTQFVWKMKELRPKGTSVIISSPSTSRKTLEETDFIILVGIYSRTKYKFFIFNKKKGDYKKYSEIGCWSANRKTDKGKRGDKTIYYIKDYDKNKVTKSSKKMVEKYFNKKYLNFWRRIENNWKTLIK